MKRLISKFGFLSARALALVLAFAIVLSPFATAVRSESVQDSAAVSYTAQYNSVLDYLWSQGAPSFGSTGGEWKVLSLARSGRLQPSHSWAATYYSLIEQTVRSNGSAVLDSNKSTENSRVIIALTSIGRDARSVAGYDLTSPFSDFNYVKRQGVNGPIWTLLALDANSAYGMSAIKNQCINYILEKELSGGGWAFAGNNADPDMTCMAVTALSRHRSNSSVSAAINRALNKLSEMQRPNGGFASYGQESAESCAWVTVALSALGINAGTDSRFVKNGASVVDALLTFYTGSGFSHTHGSGVNQMASEQSAYALCAYDRFLHGSNALFNMNDVSLNSPQPTPTPTPRPTPTPTPTPTPKPTPKPTPWPWVTPTPTPSHAPTSAPSSTPTTAPTPTPTLTPTSAPTSVPSSIPTGAPTDAPTDVPATTLPTDEPDVTTDPTEDPALTEDPNLTDEPIPTDEPASSEEPLQTDDPALAEEPSASPDASLDPIDPDATEAPADASDVTFDPIDIVNGNWNGDTGTKRDKLKWIIPAAIGGALLISGLFFIIASKKRQ